MASSAVPTSEGDDLDRVIEVLADGTRRQLLNVIAESGSDHGTHIYDLTQRSDDDSEKFRILLYHHHLPTLEDAGVIQWNRETSVIRKGAAFEEACSLLSEIQDERNEL